MEAFKKEHFVGAALLEKIKSFHVADADLIRDLRIAEPTLRSYRKHKEKISSRASEPQAKLLVLEHGLELIRKLGFRDKEFDTFRKLVFEDKPLFEFINTHASNPLLEKLVLTIIEKELGTARRMNPLEIYRDRYGYLNDETLTKASSEDPDLLVELVQDTNLRPSTRGDILQMIALGARDKYFDFVFEQLKSPAPHLREAALLSLYSYYEEKPKYSFLRAEFLRLLESEKAEGVRKTLQQLLDEM